MLIPLNELILRHGIQPKGVIHIGASLGQEAEDYANNGIKNMVFIEAIPEIFEQLKNNVARYGAIAINACVSDVDDQEVEFNVASNEAQSSSLFEFDQHTMEHPTVTFVDKIKLTTKRMDTILKENNIDITQYDMVACDLQGAELLAMKSFGDLLTNFKIAYLEVNERPMYKGIPLIGEVDEYMAKYGFEVAETNMLNFGWGDQLLIRR